MNITATSHVIKGVAEVIGRLSRYLGYTEQLSCRVEDRLMPHRTMHNSFQCNFLQLIQSKPSNQSIERTPLSHALSDRSACATHSATTPTMVFTIPREAYLGGAGVEVGGGEAMGLAGEREEDGFRG